MAADPYNQTMHVRRITLDDGRYLLLYTFDVQTTDSNQVKARPRAEPDAAEEGGEEAIV